MFLGHREMDDSVTVLLRHHHHIQLWNRTSMMQIWYTGIGCPHRYWQAWDVLVSCLYRREKPKRKMKTGLSWNATLRYSVCLVEIWSIIILIEYNFKYFLNSFLFFFVSEFNKFSFLCKSTYSGTIYQNIHCWNHGLT